MIRLRGLVIIDKRKAARKALFRALFNVQGEWSEVEVYEHVTSIATILLKFQERQMSCQMLLFTRYG